MSSSQDSQLSGAYVAWEGDRTEFLRFKMRIQLD